MPTEADHASCTGGISVTSARDSILVSINPNSRRVEWVKSVCCDSWKNDNTDTHVGLKNSPPVEIQFLAAFIGIDWNGDGLRLVAGRGTGSKMALEQAIFLPEPFRENPNDALAVGKQLQALLKQASIKGGTVYAAVGREHLV